MMIIGMTKAEIVSNHDKKMGAFLREVSNWDWEEFFRAEHDDQYTSNEAIIFSLIRSCAMQKMEAIKMSLNRLDGKLKTPVIIEYPKIFYLFPNAKISGADREQVGASRSRSGASREQIVSGELIAAPPLPDPEVEVNDLPSLSLRETLTKMADYPRELPMALIERAQEVERAVNNNRPMPDDVPKVKSVVAAHLLVMAANRNLGALNEVFDQIDGKLAETIQILGDDIFITNYSTVAPDGAVVNDDGVLQLQAEAAQSLWAEKLGRDLSR